MSARILIADDHEVVRQGIRAILQARPDWEICGEAIDGREAIRLAKQLRPDVIIMDITMPHMSGLEASQEIANLQLPSRVLIFTMHESKSYSPLAPGLRPPKPANLRQRPDKFTPPQET